MAKDLWLNLRTTAEELSAWKEKAKKAGLPLSQLLRRALNRAVVHNRADDRDLVIAMTRIGVNLNQLAHWANTYRGAPEALEVIPKLVELDRMVRELARQRGERAS